MTSSVVPCFAVLTILASTLQAGAPADIALDGFALADPNLTIDLVAAEPNIEDPVAMCFVDDLLFVCEMRGFQLGEQGRNLEGRGRIRQLEDRDRDGYYEHASVFADRLLHPTAIHPYKQGILVGAPPDILYFQDTDKDGVADVKRILFSGFGTGNHERLINSFYWGLDNWIYACAGGNGGEIRNHTVADPTTVSVDGRDFRFRETADGSWQIEAITGGGQFGITPDDADNRFTCWNSSHIIHVVLPDRYMKRNPYFAAPHPLLDIPDHGAAARIYRTSPLEHWRVVRTTERRNSPDASRFPASELQPGGYFTAACGLNVFYGNRLGNDYPGDVFVCDAANNLIHRDRLRPHGVTFTASRMEEEVEFLTSTDNWFRPTCCVTGPDGSLYIVDMYRDISETPTSIKPELLAEIDLAAGFDQGRLYRVRQLTDRAIAPPPRLTHAASHELVTLLGDDNRTVRLTAQRLLIERGVSEVIDGVREIFTDSANPIARLHAICTLEGLGGLTVETIRTALADDDHRIRIHALRFAEPYLDDSRLAAALEPLLDDENMQVRFQLAMTLGELPEPQRTPLLARLALRDGDDVWMRSAILSSLSKSVVTFWIAVTKLAQPDAAALPTLTSELMTLVAAQKDQEEFDRALTHCQTDEGSRDAALRARALQGLIEGINRAGAGKLRITTPLIELTQSAEAEVRRRARQLGGMLAWPASQKGATLLTTHDAIAADTNAVLAERISAVRLLRAAPATETADLFRKLLRHDSPPELQKSVIDALVQTGRAVAGDILLDISTWNQYTPDIRGHVIEGVTSRTALIAPLLSYIEAGEIAASTLSAEQVRRLTEHKDKTIAGRAQKVLNAPTDADRKAVLDRYMEALTLTGDTKNGRDVFRANCAICHRLEEVGHAVGPDLNGVRDRDPAALLDDMLQPSRVITAGFHYYIVETQEGETLSGIIAAESENALTLRMQEGVERTLLRSNIVELRISQLSMMPQELEQNINLQQMADLIAYLKSPK